jgi:hypothetical protein
MSNKLYYEDIFCWNCLFITLPTGSLRQCVVIKTETEDGSWCGSSEIYGSHPSDYAVYSPENLVLRLKVTPRSHWTELVIFPICTRQVPLFQSQPGQKLISLRLQSLSSTSRPVPVQNLKIFHGRFVPYPFEFTLKQSLYHSTQWKINKSVVQRRKIKITLEVFLLKHLRNSQ